MKRVILVGLCVLTLNVAAYAHTANAADGLTDKGVWAREGTVLGRGSVNILSSPAELIWTPVREKDIHPKAWPITVIPQTAMNIITRISSGVYDIVVYSVSAPFTNNITPLSEPMGLPELPWSEE